MDFDLIVFLLIFLFPLFQRLFGKKQPQPSKSKRTPREVESTPSEQIEDPLGEALRQIREALGEPTEPTPEPTKPVVAKRDDEFREIGDFEHEAHGFGRENPISEEVFEQRPAFQTHRSTKRIPQKTLRQVNLSTPLEVKKADDTATSSRTDLTRRLRRASSARNAFVLKEILDAPRSQRPIR